MLLLLHKANNLPMPRQPKMVWAVWGCNKIHACSKAIRGQSGKHGALKFPRFLYSPRPMPMRGKFLNGSGASCSPARRCCNIEPPNKIYAEDTSIHSLLSAPAMLRHFPSNQAHTSLPMELRISHNALQPLMPMGCFSSVHQHVCLGVPDARLMT